MATSNGTQNGKVDLLARAMAAVFQECMEKTRESIRDDAGSVRGDVEPVKRDVDAVTREA